MTNPEIPTPNTDRGDPSPPHPSEIDVTNSTEQPGDLADVISDAFVEAEASGGELPEWGARAVAQSLADRSDGPAPALHDFTASGEGDLEAISHELRPIYNQPGCSPWVQKQIDYLLTFLHNRTKPADTTATATGEERMQKFVDKPLSAQAAEGIEKHGDAFRAFLRLPDIDQNDPNLTDVFLNCYIGMVFTVDDLLEGLTEITEWEAELDSLTERLGIDQFVTLDRRAIEKQVRAMWDVVDFGGALYVFDK